MNKKVIIIVLLLVAVIGGLGANKLFFSKKPASQEAATKKKKIAPPVNTISVDQRAYVKIIPNSNGHNLTLEVDEVKKKAESVDYELEYQAGSLLQGAFGQIMLSAIPARKDVLLGSCSAGGACTYHEDVQGGSLLLNFDGDEDYGLKSDWKYIDNKAKETAFSSRDAKFQIDSKDLKTVRYLVIYNSPGFAKGLEGQIISDVYNLAGSADLAGEAKLTIRMSEETTGKIMGYDGSKWQEFKTTVSGKEATATVKLMESYVVVK